MLYRLLALGLLLAMLPGPSQAGKFNKKLSLGDTAPAWTNLPGTDGKNHSLADLKDREWVVVVFTCNSCACSVEYEDRIIAFEKKYRDKVALVAINVNTIADDKLDAMKKRAEKKKFEFPYLYDESQKIAVEYGATYTPEFFLLNKERKIVYLGAFDDKTNEKDVQTKFLPEAIDLALSGKKIDQPETNARGCLIRYKRTRD